MKIGPQKSILSEPDRYRILLVDSDTENRLPIKQYLEVTDRYEVIESGTGKNALELIEKFPFHLIILDETLTDFKGLDLLKTIRERFIDIPIVLKAKYTGSVGVETFALGADDCIYLPLVLDEFKYRIERALNYHHLLKTRESLEKENKELWGRAITDRLTGLYNRQYFEEVYNGEFERTKRYRSQLGCLLFDIDHFKKVNDDYGHLVGDAVLRTIGKLVLNTIRRVDIAARYGGEEFVILMPETTPEGLKHVGERVRTIIATHNFSEDVKNLEEPLRQVTISLGAVHYPKSAVNDSTSMLKLTDDKLYEAKRNGRNRLEIAWTE
ncbi:diguanylate cyclase [bacterium]|nr:diguanylate cyclase [bacterium]